MMKKASLLVVALLLSSCAVVSHMEEALVLDDYSKNRDQQALYVEDQNSKFDELLTAIHSGEVYAVKQRGQFIQRFGDPVLVQTSGFKSNAVHRLLYRHATDYFGPKVYVFFGADGRLQKVVEVDGLTSQSHEKQSAH